MAAYLEKDCVFYEKGFLNLGFIFRSAAFNNIKIIYIKIGMSAVSAPLDMNSNGGFYCWSCWI